MPVDYKESINKLNDLLKDSDGEPIDIDLLIETLIDKNIDEEMKMLVKLALDSYAVSYTHLTLPTILRV